MIRILLSLLLALSPAWAQQATVIQPTFDNNAWTTWTITPFTCGVGSPTTITSVQGFQSRGKTTTFSADITMTDIGTCTTALIFQLPVVNNASTRSVCSAVNTSTLAPLVALMTTTGASTLQVRNTAGAFPGVNTNIITVNCTYWTT